MQIPTFSVIIPTYNEEDWIHVPLNCLKKQTLQPTEIIVSDCSKDKTTEIAKRYGCKIVKCKQKGPAINRNTGAKEAIGEVLFFLDADTKFPNDYLEKAMKEFTKHKCTIAMTSFTYDSKRASELFVGFVFNWITFVQQYISKLAHGFCIICTREVFEKLNGFDEEMKLAEDNDFSSRASKHGKFRFLRSTKILVSPRRYRDEGLVKVLWSYLVSYFKMIFGKKIKHSDSSIDYDFGKHSKK